VYIIVVRGGKVGYYLLRELLDTQQEVLLIEQTPARYAEIAQELGDSVVMEGDGCEASTMERAGAGRADLVVAVTGDDEDNLVVCQVAKHQFDVPRTVARVNNPNNELIFRKLGIDTTVSATSVILAQIEQELPAHRLIPLMTLKGSALEIVEVKIPPDAAVVGRPIRDLLLPHQSLISLIVDADGQPRIPTSETVIHAGDEVVAVTMRETESSLRVALTSPSSVGPAGEP
jgi:trk system potassium uptake protein TrkA